MPLAASFCKGQKSKVCLTCGQGSGDNIKMLNALKFWGLLLLLVSSSGLYADIDLKIYRPDIVDGDELEIKIPMVSNGSLFELEVDLPSGSAGSLNGAAKTFVPILGDNDYPKASIYSLNSSSKANDLPQMTSSLVMSTASLTFEKEITITSGNDDLYLHAAVASSLSSNDWRVIGRNASRISPSAQEERHKVSFNLTDFCGKSDLLKCDELVDSDDAVMAQVYFFLADTILPLNSAVDPEDSGYNHGVYYEVYLSSDVHASNPTNPGDEGNLVDLLELRRGDESLNLKYKSDFTIDQFKRVIVAQYLGNVTDGDFIGESALKLFGNSKADEFPRSEEGTVLVEPLKNGEAATLSVAFMDKYGFVTPLSRSQTETPLEIEVLLQEQSCFFFTAGFGREHWVIDELKKFRDEVLTTTPIGSVVVDIYYELAPKYAYIILEHPWLQSMVRGIAYVLVFFIQSSRLVLALGLIALGFASWRLIRRRSSFQSPV